MPFDLSKMHTCSLCYNTCVYCLSLIAPWFVFDFTDFLPFLCTWNEEDTSPDLQSYRFCKVLLDLRINSFTMLPAITKLLPHLPRVFRQKVNAKSSVAGDQAGGSDIVTSAVSKRLSVRVVLLDRSELTLFAKVINTSIVD